MKNQYPDKSKGGNKHPLVQVLSFIVGITLVIGSFLPSALLTQAQELDEGTPEGLQELSTDQDLMPSNTETDGNNIFQEGDQSAWMKSITLSTDAMLIFSTPASLVEISSDSPTEIPIMIQLLDAEGKPLVGIHVFLVSGNSYFGDAGKVEPEEGITDGEGRVEAKYWAQSPEDIVDLYATCRTPQGNALYAQLTLIKDDPKRTDNKTIESLVALVGAMKQPSAPVEGEALLDRVKEALGLKEKPLAEESAGDFNEAVEQLAQEQSQTMEIKEGEKVIDLILSADSTELSKEFIGSKNFSIETSPAIPGIVKLSLAGDRDVILNTPQVTLPSSGPGNGSFRVLAPGARTFTISATFSPLKQQDEGAYGTGSLTFVQGITEKDKEEQEEIKDSLQAYLEWARQPGLILVEETDGTRTLRVTAERNTGVRIYPHQILKGAQRAVQYGQATILDLAKYNLPADGYLPLKVTILEGNQLVSGAEVEVQVNSRATNPIAFGLGANMIATPSTDGRFSHQVRAFTDSEGSISYIYYPGSMKNSPVTQEGTLYFLHGYAKGGETSAIRATASFPIIYDPLEEIRKVEDPIILEAYKLGEDPDRPGDQMQNEIARLQNVWTIHVGLKRDLEEMKNVKILFLSGGGEFGPTKSQLSASEPSSDNIGNLLGEGLVIKLEHDKPDTPEVEGDLEPEKDYAIVSFTPAGLPAHVTARILPTQTTTKNIRYIKTIQFPKISVSKKQQEEEKKEPQEVKKYGITVGVSAQKYEVRTNGQDQTILDIKIDPTEGSQSGKIKKKGNPMLVYLGYRGPRGDITYLRHSGNNVYDGFVGNYTKLVGTLTGADPSRLFQVHNDKPSEINLKVRYSELKTGDKVQGLTINTPSEYWVWIYFKYEGNDVTVKSNSVTITKLAVSSQAPEQPETPEEPQQPAQPEEPKEPEQPEEPETPEEPKLPIPFPNDPFKPWDDLLEDINSSRSFSPAERQEIADLINQHKRGELEGWQVVNRLNYLVDQKSDAAKKLLYSRVSVALIDRLLYDMKGSGEYSEEDLEEAYRAGQQAKTGDQAALDRLRDVLDRRSYTKFWWGHKNDTDTIGNSLYQGGILQPRSPSGSKSTPPSGGSTSPTSPETTPGVGVSPSTDTEIFTSPSLLAPALGTEEETSISSLGKITEETLDRLVEMLLKLSNQLKF